MGVMKVVMENLDKGPCHYIDSNRHYLNTIVAYRYLNTLLLILFDESWLSNKEVDHSSFYGAKVWGWNSRISMTPYPTLLSYHHDQ